MRGVRSWRRGERAATELSRRWVSTARARDPWASLARSFEPGRRPPLLVPFAVQPSVARHRFLQFQRGWLRPTNPLEDGTYTLEARYVPHWVFSVSQVQGSCSALHTTPNGEERRLEKDVGALLRGLSRASPPLVSVVNVCASYQHIPDQARVCQKQGSHAGEWARSLTPAEGSARRVERRADEESRGGDGAESAGWPAQRAEGGSKSAKPREAAPAEESLQLPACPELEAPEMSQAIAWGFVKRQLHADVMHAMEALIRASEPKAKIESVEVDLTRLDRHARLVYLPRYVLSYTWGERFNVSGERHKEMFQAIISGEKDHDFNVGAARHYSPVKASLLGAAAAASALAVLTLAEVLPPAYALGMDGLFATAIATCLSGFAAHAVQHASRSRAESGVAAQEERAFGAATATGFGPAAPARGQAEDALEAAEWARWALCGAAHSEWSPATRARWARELWAAQHRRRAQARRQVARAAAADAQEKRDAAREEARRARWGRSRHEERMERSRAAFEGMGRGRRASGRSGGHRLHDPLGYYALLGIASHGTNEPPSLRCIREGFRAAALKHHPDRLPHEAGAAERSRAARRFAQVSRAYQVLRNPATRARYDSGLPLH